MPIKQIEDRGTSQEMRSLWEELRIRFRPRFLAPWELRMTYGTFSR